MVLQRVRRTPHQRLVQRQEDTSTATEATRSASAEPTTRAASVTTTAAPVTSSARETTSASERASSAASSAASSSAESETSSSSNARSNSSATAKSALSSAESTTSSSRMTSASDSSAFSTSDSASSTPTPTSDFSTDTGSSTGTGTARGNITSTVSAKATSTPSNDSGWRNKSNTEKSLTVILPIMGAIVLGIALFVLIKKLLVRRARKRNEIQEIQDINDFYGDDTHNPFPAIRGVGEKDSTLQRTGTVRSFGASSDGGGSVSRENVMQPRSYEDHLPSPPMPPAHFADSYNALPPPPSQTPAFFAPPPPSATPYGEPPYGQMASIPIGGVFQRTATPAPNSAPTPAPAPALIPEPTTSVVRNLASAGPSPALPPPALASGLAPGSVKILAAFDPTASDELDVQAGERVCVLKRFSDGWSMVRSLQTGREGMVPGEVLEQPGSPTAGRPLSSVSLEGQPRRQSLLDRH